MTELEFHQPQRTQRKTITWACLPHSAWRRQEDRQDHLAGENPLSLKFPALDHHLPKSSRTATIFGARNLFRQNVSSDNTRWTIPQPGSLINHPADCRRRAEAALWRAAKAESPRSAPKRGAGFIPQERTHGAPLWQVIGLCYHPTPLRTEVRAPLDSCNRMGRRILTNRLLLRHATEPRRAQFEEKNKLDND